MNDALKTTEPELSSGRGGGAASIISFIHTISFSKFIDRGRVEISQLRRRNGVSLTTKAVYLALINISGVVASE